MRTSSSIKYHLTGIDENLLMRIISYTLMLEKMPIRTMILSFFIVLPLVLVAQDPADLQTIETVNGVTYEGWVIDNVDGIVTLEDARGDTLGFLEDEIVRWTNPFFFVYKRDKFHRKDGNFSMVNVGFGGQSDAFTMQFNYAIGKRLTPRLSIGLGTGFNFSGEFDDLVGQEFFAELYIYTKYYLNDKSIRPFIETKGGAFSGIEGRIRNDLYPGLLLQGGIGLEFAQATETRFSIMINYLYMYGIAKVISLASVLDDLSLKRPLIGISFNF